MVNFYRFRLRCESGRQQNLRSDASLRARINLKGQMSTKTGELRNSAFGADRGK